MGLAEKLAGTAAGLAIVGLVLYVFRDKIVSGAKSVGATIGQAGGASLGSIFPNFGKSFVDAFTIPEWGSIGGVNAESLRGKTVTMPSGYQVYIPKDTTINPDGTISSSTPPLGGSMVPGTSSVSRNLTNDVIVNQGNREYSDFPRIGLSQSIVAKQQALSEKYGITTYDIKGNISTVPQTRAGIALSQNVAKSGQFVQQIGKSGAPVRSVGVPTPNQSQSKAVTGGNRPANTSSASKAVKAANTSKPSASKASKSKGK